tara:strand:- start:198 stop:1334 length:1137 start_codon:yes stop_codon:yes gene_type:complete
MSQTKVEAPFVEGGGGTNFKNLIINGDFQIAQRSTSAVTAGNGTFTTVDRWKTFTGNLGGAYTTQQKSNSLADQATTGQENYLEIKCTSTDSSVHSQAYAMIRQQVEATSYLQSKLRYGTSDAQKLTLSFWIKTNLTGTHSMSWYYNGSTDGNSTYYYPFNFTVSSADTWEKKIITIPAPPTSYGSINAGNATGGLLNINLQIGSDYQDPAGSWTGNIGYASPDVQNFFTSTDNNILITAIQLEVGDDASEFEHLPFDIQLTRCLRYYFDLASTGIISPGAPTYICNCSYWNSGQVFGFVHFPTVMRAEPTLTTTNATNTFYAYVDGSGDGLDDLSLNSQSNLAGVMVQNNTDASGTGGQAGGLYLNSGKICNFSAEL